MKVIEVTIKGITPLLMHRFAATGADAGSKKRTGIPDWKAEAELALYQNEGELYQPAEHLERALAIAGAQFRIPGKRGQTYSRLIGATVDIMPEAIPHKIQKYVIDSRPVVVRPARVIRYRPRLDEWELSFTLRLHDEQLPLPVIKEILDYAGLYVGIGDYRPARKGKYGKFMVVEFKEIESE